MGLNVSEFRPSHLWLCPSTFLQMLHLPSNSRQKDTHGHQIRRFSSYSSTFFPRSFSYHRSKRQTDTCNHQPTRISSWNWDLPSKWSFVWPWSLSWITWLHRTHPWLQQRTFLRWKLFWDQQRQTKRAILSLWESIDWNSRRICWKG